MKKYLIGIGSLLILAFVVVLFVNATDSKKDSKKAKAEVKKVEVVAPCSATCNYSALDKTAPCDPEKCKEMNCDHKDGKCDPATCTSHTEGANKEGKACRLATACPGSCHARKTSEVK